MTEVQKACTVQMSAVATSPSCARRRARTAASFSELRRATRAARSRSFISDAARFVNVTASTEDTSAFSERMREMIFSTITKVLPLPADAETSTSPAGVYRRLLFGCGFAHAHLSPLLFCTTETISSAVTFFSLRAPAERSYPHTAP